MPIQVQEAYDELQLLKQDISDVDNDLFISWFNHVNIHAYRFVSGIDSERFITELSLNNVTSGAQNLPSDFSSIQYFNTGIFYLDSNGNSTNRQLPLLPFGSTQPGYYLNGTQIVFLNIVTSTNFVLRYIPTPPALTSMDDYFTTNKLSTGKEIIPSQYLLALRDHLDVMYSQWDEDVSYESVADFRWARELGEMARNIRRTPSSYGSDGFSIIF